MHDYDPLDLVKPIILEKFNHKVRHMLSREFLEDSADLEYDIDAYVNRAARTIVLSLKAEILGQRLEQITWNMPRDWKEAVKDRFAPKWLKKRYPVKYVKFTIEPRVLYPQIALPDEKHFIRYERIED